MIPIVTGSRYLPVLPAGTRKDNPMPRDGGKNTRKNSKMLN